MNVDYELDKIHQLRNEEHDRIAAERRALSKRGNQLTSLIWISGITLEQIIFLILTIFDLNRALYNKLSFVVVGVVCFAQCYLIFRFRRNEVREDRKLVDEDRRLSDLYFKKYYELSLKRITIDSPDVR